MSDTTFLLLLSGGTLLATSMAIIAIAFGVYQWGKPRRPQAKR